ncbi:transcription elongation factor family protein [Striga asiatica]|uniref:Transcription elongation factor family protein n=1 Tax=Striga asiatica TaxID=4170 RepID=A0A5A7PQF1_STRAF|nr:transcription elongation factor family protein [Striga asiatica]
MDSDEFRAILSGSRVGIWEMIEAAIRVASSDHGDELRRRRDKIVESLYAPAARTCRNCGGDDDEARDHRFHHTNNYTNSDDVEDKVNSPDCNNKRFDVVDDGDDHDDDDDKTDRNLDGNFRKSPLTPESNHRSFSGGEEGEDVDPYGGLFDDEQTRILTIKEQLEDPNQSEDDVVELLHNLSDMDITFQALKETDIGRHVNRLRKHPSNEVRILVKQLVRKWKETVDDWVKVNQPQRTSDLNADVDSPQQNIPKNQQNGHHQRAQQREPALDDERLNSARRRLQENYQEAQNAKKQRTIQVMDIHEIPKPKNAYFAKNKGGFQGRNHR